MNPVVWVHADSLRPKSPVFRTYAGAAAIFVWDDDVIEREGWGLKRIGFLYECLLELPVAIRRGHTATTVLGFAGEAGATCVATMDSPDPGILATIEELCLCVEVKVHPEDPFVELPKNLDLKRFSRYWKRVEPLLIR